jgi:predicted dehydrogenase
LNARRKPCHTIKLKDRSMKTICIVGFGAVCENAHIPVIKELKENYILKGIFDVDKERRKKASEICGVNVYDNLLQMLEKEKPNCLVITTPPSSHKEIILKAIERGIDVLCEKPLVTNLEDFKEIQKFVNKTSRIVYTVHNWIYSPHIIEIKKFMDEIGSVRRINWETLRKKPSQSASSNWRVDPKISGGGIIFDHGWHVIYIMRSFIGKSFTDVNPFFLMNESGIDEVADFRIEYEDVVSDIHLSWRSPIRKNIMTAYGDGGVLVFDDEKIYIYKENGEVKEHFFNEKMSQSSAHPIWTKNVYIDFYNSFKNRKKFEENFDEALECIMIIEKAYEKYKQRKTQKLHN